MTEKEYRQHPAISRSELWEMRRTPQHFRYFKDHPNEPTPALLFGQVVHKLLLEPEDFDSEFVIAPEIDRRTKAGKEQWSDFLDHIGLQQVITQDMYQQASEMATAARKSPLVMDYLAGEHETPFFWTDPDTGEACKCRTDCLTYMGQDEVPTIVDYKSASDASTDKFVRDIYNYGYHFQAAMYSDGVMNALRLSERPQFVFIVQEKTPPYSVNIVTVPPDVMLAGLDTYRYLLGEYHSCKETGFWPGYLGPFNIVNEAYLPGWMQGEVD